MKDRLSNRVQTLPLQCFINCISMYVWTFQWNAVPIFHFSIKIQINVRWLKTLEQYCKFLRFVLMHFNITVMHGSFKLWKYFKKVLSAASATPRLAIETPLALIQNPTSPHSQISALTRFSENMTFSLTVEVNEIQILPSFVIDALRYHFQTPTLPHPWVITFTNLGVNADVSHLVSLLSCETVIEM